VSKTVAIDGLLIFMYEMTCNRSKLNFKTITINFFFTYDDILPYRQSHWWLLKQLWECEENLNVQCTLRHKGVKYPPQSMEWNDTI
jgi:hypothetical protein